MTFPRVRAMIFVAVLFVTAGVVVLTAINKDTQTQPPQELCRPGEVRVNVDVPEDRSKVTINVLNGSPSRNGLAQQVGAEFSHRGFTVAKMEDSPEGEFGGVARIVYGPEGVGAAWLVSAYFLPAYFLDGDAAKVFDIERIGPEVDVILGNKFQQLATSSEVNQAIAQEGAPIPPPGTCEA
jgi:hypothetical protein